MWAAFEMVRHKNVEHAASKSGNCSAPPWSASVFCTVTAKFVYAVFPKILYVIITFRRSDRAEREQEVSGSWSKLRLITAIRLLLAALRSIKVKLSLPGKFVIEFK
jgi:hypothetical protein